MRAKNEVYQDMHRISTLSVGCTRHWIKATFDRIHCVLAPEVWLILFQELHREDRDPKVSSLRRFHAFLCSQYDNC